MAHSSMTPNPSSKLNSDHEDSGMIRFGVFEFTFSTSELRRNGILMRLQVHEDPIAAQLGCGKAELEDAKADRT